MPRVRRRPSIRGAATVEMAISMLLIVPIFLYALFMDDLLRYKLSQQEAVVTTLWDYTDQDYDLHRPSAQTTGIDWTVQHNARLMFCDHESGLNHYQDKNGQGEDQRFDDCTSTAHHKGAVVAHECWLNDKAEQITCTGPNAGVGASSDSIWKAVQSGQHKESGMYTCEANLVVENYLLPKTFMQQFSDTNLSKENWGHTGKDAHVNAQAGTGQTAYYFEKDHLAIVADAWAYTKPQTVKAGEKKGGTETTAFWDEMNTAFTQNRLYEPYRVVADLFTARLMSQNVLNPLWLKKVDDPTTPNLSIGITKAPSVTVQQDQGSGSYFSSPWSTGSNAYQQTYNARGDNYMGCQSPESC